jgi:hypothetical protein
MTSDRSTAEALLNRLHAERRETHTSVLRCAEALTDDRLRWRPTDHAPSIGFHVWHLARWADYDAWQLTGSPQVWQARGLAEAWGFPAGLGQNATGTEMGNEAAQQLPLPDKAALIDYTRAAFDALGVALEALALDDLPLPIDPPRNSDPRLAVLFEYVTHDNRHLGMIEALRGLLGDSGTATR